MTLFASFDQQAVLAFSSLLNESVVLRNIFITLALAGVYIIPISWIIVWFYRPNQRLLLLSAISSGIIAWIGLNNLIQLFYFQNRPVHELPVREWFFERPENSFPSDHIAFLAGIACFLLLQRHYRPAWWLLFLALLVGVARVAVAVHYPSDIVFGFVTGAIAAFALFKIDPWLQMKIWPFFIRLAERLKLG